MSDFQTEADAVLEFADEHLVDVVEGDLYDVVTLAHSAARKVTVIDHERRLEAPRRDRGTTVLHTPESFIEWVRTNRSDDPTPAVFADVDQLTVTAVLDPSKPDTPRWADSRGVVTLRPTPEWVAWSKADGALVPQAAFAEFVQRWAHTFLDPTAMDMRDVAESLTIYGESKVSDAVRTRDGQRSIVYEETLTTSATNAGGRVDVPEQITVRCPLFEGTDPEEIELLLLFRRDGGVKLGVQIIDRPGLLRRAFDQVTSQIAEGLALVPLCGSAPGTITASVEVI